MCLLEDSEHATCSSETSAIRFKWGHSNCVSGIQTVSKNIVEDTVAKWS